MTTRTVLVAGPGPVARAAAIALAGDGVDVTLIAYAVGRRGSDDDVRALHDDGVEAHPEVELVGSLAVDRHIEAELSNGRVENYDALLIADGDELRVVSAATTSSATLDQIARALGDAG